ncbi:hypothetical protein SteCoe_35905 [Stentor coeruleus]|uniref:Transcriptional coactivator p15 (PC4) C-terminal domain-containing protein n=1 Tax=Stentor coeruleus TaxID=5963 RepID=A0A1R2AR99_9CILI|nr:hypothetical protein SteCoe_35905 [Stentor coeruleus]
MDNEENKIQLASQRFVEVSKFRGKTYISIREFYEDAEGNLKPGKKGISLTTDQWKKLCENVHKVDRMIDRLDI